LKQLLTAKRCAELLGVTETTLGRWRDSKKHLPYLRVGNRIRYCLEDVEAYLKSTTTAFSEEVDCSPNGSDKCMD